MTEDEFDQWHNHHADLFQFHGDADATMFRAWMPMVMRYSLAEMTEASNWLILQTNIPLVRAHHLGKLRAHVWECRKARIDREKESQAGPEISCENCAGYGFVAVPDLRTIHNDQWEHPYSTSAVVCSCHAGARIHDVWTRREMEVSSDQKKPEQMGLAKYYLLNHNWREQMADHENGLKDEIHARDVSAYADEEARKAKLKSILMNLGKPERKLIHANP